MTQLRTNNLADGSVSTAKIADGAVTSAKLNAQLGFSNLAFITATGNWTIPTGVTKCRVEVRGGGAGGTTNAGGGGQGGLAIKIVSGLIPGNTVSCTIGAGGAANGNGGTTSFGAHCSATGGNNAGGNFLGGTGSGGDINRRGAPGVSAAVISTACGLNYGGPGGGEGAGALYNGTPQNAEANSGGGGAASATAPATGGSGYIIIEY